MELLWAPWRIPYLKKITREKKPAPCFFCEYVPAPKKDRENLVLHRGKTCFTVLNRFPYTGGHLLVTVRHSGTNTTVGTRFLDGLPTNGVGYGVLGQCVQYDLGNVFDPAYTMVCKLARKWLIKIAGAARNE